MRANDASRLSAVFVTLKGVEASPSTAGRKRGMGMEAKDGAEAAVRGVEQGTLLYIEVQPGSASPGRLSFDPWRRRIRLSVRARAEGGKANEEVQERLAAILGAAAASVRLTAGTTDRQKTVLVAGMAPGEVLGKIGPALKEERPSRRCRVQKGGTGP